MPDVLNPACVARTMKVDSSCGCTLTNLSITGLSPDDIVALSTKEIYLTKAILEAKEAKMLGVQERGLMELLTGSIKDIKGDLTMQKIDQQSVVQPYIMRQQRSFINNNYFQIESGVVPADAGVGSVPVSAFDVTVNLGPSWLKTDLSSPERYFVPGSTLIVMTWDNIVTKTAKTLVYTIYRAVNANAGAVNKAKVTIIPPYGTAGWNALSGAEKTSWRPTFGIAQTGTNSTSDFESYCPIQPSDLSNKLNVTWLQTIRENYCREQSYEEILDQILKGKVNDYLKAFKYVGIAEQHKQQAARNRREFFNTVFYGVPIDVVNQTTANWQSLPIVYDITNNTCPLAYKASAEGIFTQLSNCNRVVDMLGNKLNIDYIFQQMYYLRRNREASGDSVQVIDSMTDRYTGSMIQEVMFKYYAQRYNLTNTVYYKANEKIKHDGMILFNYNIYDIPEASVQWAVFVDDYFNDLIDAANVQIVGWDFRTRARNLWFIDWSDISIGVADQNSVIRKTPDPTTSVLYKCVIKAPITTYDLRSKMIGIFVDRPQRHLIIHNFSDSCAKITGGSCTVPQS